MEKIEKIKSQHLGFVYSNTLGCPCCVHTQNLKTVAIIDAELIRWKKLLERKKKGQKGTDKPYVADSFIHSTTCHT